jgi:hypothetical protein
MTGKDESRRLCFRWSLELLVKYPGLCGFSFWRFMELRFLSCSPLVSVVETLLRRADQVL